MSSKEEASAAAKEAESVLAEVKTQSEETIQSLEQKYTTQITKIESELSFTLEGLK